MSAADEATLTLVIAARNIAGNAIGQVNKQIGTIGTNAATAAGRFAQSFERAGSTAAAGLGAVVSGALGSGDFTAALQSAGANAAGYFAENMGNNLLLKLGASGLVATLGATLSAAGAAIGGLIAAAIPIGMAALPFLLIGAIIAAIAVLIVNEDIRNKVLGFAGGVIGFIVDGLAKLPGILIDLFGKAWDALLKAVVVFGPQLVQTIIGGLISLPGKIVSAITDAFSHLKIDVGPFHIRSSGITIDLPNLGPDAGKAGLTYQQAHGLTGHAAGGWAGLRGPELSMLGERGPEFVLSQPMLRALAGARGADPGYEAVAISRRDIERMVDQHLYFAIRRAAPTRARA